MGQRGLFLSKRAIMSRATGRLVDEVIQSKAVGKPMRLHIYLPPYYGEFGMRYPVIYLLHHWGSDEWYWTTRLGLFNVAEHLIGAGTVRPFMVVMPQGDKSFFINAEDPGGDFSPLLKMDPAFFKDALEGYGDYGDYLLNEVITHIDQGYETRAERAGRAIGGISMGGTGAAVLAFTHPELFSAVGIHSPVLFSERRLGPPWIFGLGDPVAFAQRDPIHLTGLLGPNTGLRLFLDCGQDDDLADLSEQLHSALTQAGVTHTYVSRPGKHNDDYWRANLAQYLGFYAAGW
jgi:enterochelin esterase-like enzyme